MMDEKQLRQKIAQQIRREANAHWADAHDHKWFIGLRVARKVCLILHRIADRIEESEPNHVEPIGNAPAFFIGGPLNHKVDETTLFTQNPSDPPSPADYIRVKDGDGFVVYHLQEPLETGMPVYSCLPGADENRGGARFGLTSIGAKP